jgi:hypothetical protein
MSSPLDRDFGPDEPSPYAPKWVRDAAEARRGKPGERPATMPKSAPGLDSDVARRPARDLDSDIVRRSPVHSAAASDPVVVERYRLPRSLEPTLMPEPWPVPRMRSALGLLARFTIAIAIAAVVALFVIGKFPTSWLTAGIAQKQDSPSFGSRFSGQNAATAQQPRAATAQYDVPQERGTGGVALTRTVENAPVVQAPVSAAPTNAVAQAPSAIEPQPARVAAAAPPPAPAGPAKSFAVRQLSREEIADLVRRGEAFMASGDLASARLVLQRAAEGGDPRAALMLAGTYDPIALEKLGIQGFASDIAAARTWYERAREFGSAEAMRRLEMLASRAH